MGIRLHLQLAQVVRRVFMTQHMDISDVAQHLGHVQLEFIRAVWTRIVEVGVKTLDWWIRAFTRGA